MQVQIRILVTGDDLPPDLRDSALAATRQAVSQTPVRRTTVPVGQYYTTGLDVNGMIVSQRATQPLTAELSVAPYSTESGVSSQFVGAPFAGCSDLQCGGYTSDHPIPGTGWFVEVGVMEVWRFSTASGDLAGTVALPIQRPFVVALTYTPSDGWRLADVGSLPDPLTTAQNSASSCDTAFMLLSRLLAGGFGGSALGNNAAEGCEIQLSVQSGGGSATFIWRFGVLLAADAQAHTMLPALPIASPAEISAVAGGTP
jgi:hypothetical protein